MVLTGLKYIDHIETYWNICWYYLYYFWLCHRHNKQYICNNPIKCIGFPVTGFPHHIICYCYYFHAWNLVYYVYLKIWWLQTKSDFISAHLFIHLIKVTRAGFTKKKLPSTVHLHVLTIINIDKKRHVIVQCRLTMSVIMFLCFNTRPQKILI